jgi:hypothetical protein
MKLIKEILNSSTAVDNLLGDAGSRPLLIKQLAKELPDCIEPIWKYPKEQVLAMTLSSGLDEEEAFRVGGLINQYMLSSPFPFVALTDERKDTAWAERSLIGLGMFYDFYEARWTRRGAPKPKYYAEQAKNILFKNYEPKFASHFDNWVDFMRSTFITSPA